LDESVRFDGLGAAIVGVVTEVENEGLLTVVMFGFEPPEDTMFPEPVTVVTEVEVPHGAPASASAPPAPSFMQSPTVPVKPVTAGVTTLVVAVTVE
jgi:hypothetical protein